jgi:hypothetical protein
LRHEKRKSREERQVNETWIRLSHLNDESEEEGRNAGGGKCGRRRWNEKKGSCSCETNCGKGTFLSGLVGRREIGRKINKG